MHLDSDSPAGLDGTLATPATCAADVTDNVGACHILNRAVARRETRTLGAVVMVSSHQATSNEEKRI